MTGLNLQKTQKNGRHTTKNDTGKGKTPVPLKIPGASGEFVVSKPRKIINGFVIREIFPKNGTTTGKFPVNDDNNRKNSSKFMLLS